MVDLYFSSPPHDAGWLMNGSMSSNSSYSKLANNATLTYKLSTFDDFLILTLGMHSPRPLSLLAITDKSDQRYLPL